MAQVVIKTSAEVVKEGQRIATIQTLRRDDMVVLHISLARPITVEESKHIVEAVNALRHELARADLVAISGRGPIWMYGKLLHALLHVTRAVAFYDPKVGFVIVASHTPQYQDMQVIPVPEDLASELNQLS